MRSKRVGAWLFSMVFAASCAETAAPIPGCGGPRSRCVSQVAVGAHFGCAVLMDQTVWCWGRNDESQLGYPTTDLCPEALPDGQTRGVACHAYPFQVVGLDRAVRAVAGDAFACALRDDGTLRCWGANGVGQLGNGATLPAAAPVAVRELTDVTSLTAGARHACAVHEGKVFCWGANDRGQLGPAPAAQSCAVGGEMVPCATVPTEIPGLKGITEVRAGATHTCARTTEGLTLCWGDNRLGQLGVGEASDDPTPMPQAVLAGPLPLEGVRSLAVGAASTCALDDNGAVWCWGRNDHGELGRTLEGSVPDHCAVACAVNPVAVPGLARSALPDAGPDVLDASGDVVDENPDASMPRDATVRDDVADAGPDVTDVGPVDNGVVPAMAPRAVASGATFSCVALADGTARCWGDDRDDQLGDGQRTQDPQGPVLVIATPGAARTNPLQGVSSIAAGGATACAVLQDHSVRCWGSNQDGALGNGNTTQQSGPVPVTW